MASTKKAVPSHEKGIPKIGPACSIKVGQSMPNSKESTVPDTAPVAKKMATPFDHAFARSWYTCWPVLIHRYSAIAIKNGIAMPMQAKIRWKPRDTAICSREARKSYIVVVYRLINSILINQVIMKEV